jgi:hypothetical protein
MATQQLHSSMASRPSVAAELQLRSAATAPRIPCARAQAPFLLPLSGAQQHPCAAPLLHFLPIFPHQTAPAASRRRPWPSPLPPWPPSSLSRALRKFQQRAPPPICAASCTPQQHAPSPRTLSARRIAAASHALRLRFGRPCATTRSSSCHMCSNHDGDLIW